MTAYASLISSIPIPQQQWQTKSNVAPIASVKVGEVVKEEPAVQTPKNSESVFERIKRKLVERRMKKLESIPADQRTPVQQAEYEANQKSLDVNA